MESCLYEGVVRHERLRPVTHRFAYRLHMVLVALEEIPELLRAGFVSERRLSFNGLFRADHFGDPRITLDEAVRDEVRRATGAAPTGPIRMLSQLRTFGHYFSPLNLFYCLAPGTSAVEAVVAEVQNTPWHERHCYVLSARNRTGATGDASEHRHAKAFHVSPFMGMDVEYLWRVSRPGETLRAEIANARGGETFFRAELDLRRRAWTRQSRRAQHWKFPWMTARISAAIYWQAFGLWRKKCPFYPHPRSLEPTSRRPQGPSGPGASPASSEAERSPA